MDHAHRPPRGRDRGQARADRGEIVAACRMDLQLPNRRSGDPGGRPRQEGVMRITLVSLVGTMLGAPLVGWLLERSGSFSLPFGLLAIGSLAALGVIQRVQGQEDVERPSVTRA